MSFMDELKELKALHDGGVLTDEEFTAAKAKLLERPGESAEPQVLEDEEPEGVPDDDDTEREDGALLAALQDLFFDDDKTEILVNPDGSGDCVDLKAAIEAAPEGATITVTKGVYAGPLQIDKDLTIVGEKGVRVRPELPDEIAEHLADELAAAVRPNPPFAHSFRCAVSFAKVLVDCAMSDGGGAALGVAGALG